MIVRRKRYRIRPERADAFNEFFHAYLFPNQRKHGARLLGRWMSEDRTEIMALWEYASLDAYRAIEERVRGDAMHALAQTRRKELGELYEDGMQDFLVPTGRYAPPRHIVSVAGYVTNGAGETLLVRTAWRNDTWELPGGQVEENEPPHEALKREMWEETGIEVEPEGITGVYFNATRSILNLVFRARLLGGELTPSPETPEVGFFPLHAGNVGEYLTRPHFRQRALDAMTGRTIPCEAFRVDPYERLHREDESNRISGSPTEP
jgi:ADP-ribose pyrophosphatase YjhB (NUDIX family)